jgi:hypothetical protein
MTDDFKPPIKSRTTEELLEIAGAPKKWNERALKLALDELYNRKVDSKLIEQAKHTEKFLVEFESLIKADSRFEFFCLRPHHLFINWSEVFMFLFSWEYEKDVFYIKLKYKQSTDQLH